MCTIQSSAWPIQDLPRPRLHPFVHGFMKWVVRILTWSTFCLVCIGGKSSMNLMVSEGVSLVVPSMNRIASFCTLTRFSRFVCAIVVRSSPLSVTLITVLWYSRKRWRCFTSRWYTLYSHRLQDWQTFHVFHCCCFHVFSVGQHSVKVDPKVFQMTCSFNHRSVKCDCWHWFATCSVVKSSPQCLCLVWIDERSGVVTPQAYAIQLLHCFGCLLGVLWCFVSEHGIC